MQLLLQHIDHPVENGRLVVYCMNMVKWEDNNELLQEWFERTLAYSPVVFAGRGIFQYNWGIVPFR